LDEQTKVRLETGRSPRRTSIKVVHAGRRSPAGSRCAPVFSRGMRGKEEGANEPAARLRDVEKGRKMRRDVSAPAEACVSSLQKAVRVRFSPSPRPYGRAAGFLVVFFGTKCRAKTRSAGRGSLWADSASCARAPALVHGTRNCLQISQLNFIATSKNLNFPGADGVAVTLLRGKLLVPHNRIKIRTAAEREEDALLETARTNAQKSKS